jgi:hypothetical protein
MTRSAVFLFLLFIAPCVASAGVTCAQYSEAHDLVNRYYEATRVSGADVNAALSGLLKSPTGAACWLVSDLKPIKRAKLTVEQMRTTTGRSVWSIRALRFITNCKDYKGALANETRIDPRDPRWDLLLQRGLQEVPFFRTWMSREVVFVAPTPVQQQIIAAWTEWYAKDGDGFQYAACGDIDAWWF